MAAMEFFPFRVPLRVRLQLCRVRGSSRKSKGST